MDIFSTEKRSEIMSKINGKETKPEIITRKYLFARGLRFRKNYNRLPGHPDIVLPKYKTIVFVNGCFWHGHKGCPASRLPKSNIEYWKTKIESNIKRDEFICRVLKSMGWKVITVWECELKKPIREKTLDSLYSEIVKNSNNLINDKKKTQNIKN